jgi:hypothetical protein
VRYRQPMGNLDPWPQWAVMKALEPTDGEEHEDLDALDPPAWGELVAALLWSLALVLGLFVYAALRLHS